MPPPAPPHPRPHPLRLQEANPNLVFRILLLDLSSGSSATACRPSQRLPCWQLELPSLCHQCPPDGPAVTMVT